LTIKKIGKKKKKLYSDVDWIWKDRGEGAYPMGSGLYLGTYYVSKILCITGLIGIEIMD